MEIFESEGELHKFNPRILAMILMGATALCPAVRTREQQRSGPSRDIRFLQDVSYNPAPDADPKYQFPICPCPLARKISPCLFSSTVADGEPATRYMTGSITSGTSATTLAWE